MALSAVFSVRMGIALPVTLAAQEIWMVVAVIGVGMLLTCIPSWASYRHSVSSGLRG